MAAKATARRNPTVSIVRVTAPKPAKLKRRSVARRAVGGARQLLSSQRTGAMIGAFLLGVLDKQGTELPTVPMLGRAGTLGVATYFVGKQMRSPALDHAATGFLSIALYQFAREGKVAGVDTV